jgi:transcriptional regulator with XRE-family HTH domain
MLVNLTKDQQSAAPLRSTGQFGVDLRALRRSRNWTLSELADQLDRSVGWLSQVERNVSEPALDDVRNIAALFGLPVSFFFSQSPDQPESNYVVRANSRRTMSDHHKGLVESLLSPDLGGETEEAGYVISGSLTLTIDGQQIILNPGDSFRFAGEKISWVNNGTVDAVLIWVIAPPVY